MSLKEVGDYALEVGKGMEHGDNAVYIIRNTKTGVIEYETRVYPQARSILDQLAASLQAQLDDESGIAKPNAIETAEVSRTRTGRYN